MQANGEVGATSSAIENVTFDAIRIDQSAGPALAVAAE